MTLFLEVDVVGIIVVIVFPFLILVQVAQQRSLQIDHFDGAAGAVLALHVGAGLALFVVFGREHAVGDRNVALKAHAGNFGSRRVGDDFEVIGFAADHGTEGDERLVLVAVGHRLQRKRDFERARDEHHGDVVFGNAQNLELFEAGLKLFLAGVLVEARHHDADIHFRAVKLTLVPFHGHLSNSCVDGAEAAPNGKDYLF